MVWCDNWRKAYTMGTPIVAPACNRDTATTELTVEYREGDTDTLMLCGKCARVVAKDARRHGYTVRRRKL